MIKLTISEPKPKFCKWWATTCSSHGYTMFTSVHTAKQSCVLAQREWNRTGYVHGQPPSGNQQEEEMERGNRVFLYWWVGVYVRDEKKKGFFLPGRAIWLLTRNYRQMIVCSIPYNHTQDWRVHHVIKTNPNIVRHLYCNYLVRIIDRMKNSPIDPIDLRQISHTRSLLHTSN